MAQSILNIAILGASGYTGADSVRLLLQHPQVRIAALGADSKAGRSIAEIFPHLGFYDLPVLQKPDDIAWDKIDVVFGCLPHGASEQVLSALPQHVTVIDLSADFRLKNADAYQQWYGRAHQSAHKLFTAVYGLTEWARELLPGAQLVACPGCYPTAVLLALKPLLAAGVIQADDIIIDAKSGVSGAGRSLKEQNLFCEAGEGMAAYGIAAHRHAPEIEQELGATAAKDILVNFTPHLVPMNRGELVTCYVKAAAGVTLADARAAIQVRYEEERFANLAPEGLSPATRHVRGSNHCLINIFADRLPGRFIVIAAIDNLVKGSAGQAIQNLNVVYGWREDTAIAQAPLFP
ncbi:MAG: N-acetyl-gamma-glutamyl-phosphate reductase [Caulobacterales bacterium]